MTEPATQPAGAVAPPDPAPLLLCGASPTDKVALAIDDEFDQIESSVRMGSHRDHLRVILSRGTEPTELVQKMLDEDPSVVHFAGHGTRRAELLFEGPDGTSRPVDAETLRKMFAAFNGVVRCVVLNACYSATQAEIIAHHVDCVVGMSDVFSDAASNAFSSRFYGAMASGRNVATSFDLAVVNVDLSGIQEANTPALFGRERAAMLVFDGRQIADVEVTTTIVDGIESLARELYESEYLSLVRLASTLIDSVSVCEGIVQEAFVNILTTPVSTPVPGRPGVLGVLRSMVLDIAQERRAVASELFPDQARPVASAADDEITKVLRSIQTIAAHQARTLILSKLSESDVGAVAVALGIADDAVENTIGAALDIVGSLIEALG